MKTQCRRVPEGAEEGEGQAARGEAGGYGYQEEERKEKEESCARRENLDSRRKWRPWLSCPSSAMYDTKDA